MIQDRSGPVCTLCNGVELINIVVDGETRRQVCECVKRRKLKNKLDAAFGFYTLNKDYISGIKDIDSDKNLYLSIPIKDQAIINGILGFLWTRAGVHNINRTLKVFNVYEIAEIFLGKSEIYKSYSLYLMIL